MTNTAYLSLVARAKQFIPTPERHILDAVRALPRAPAKCRYCDALPGDGPECAQCGAPASAAREDRAACPRCGETPEIEICADPFVGERVIVVRCHGERRVVMVDREIEAVEADNARAMIARRVAKAIDSL